MIQKENVDFCSGCSACVNVCPKHCISMKPNKDGFLYPSVDLDKCVNCGLCEKRCPVLNKPVFSESLPSSYAIQNSSEAVRLDSSSGGFFSAIASYVLERGGVVFGAMFNESIEVVHGFIDNIDELPKLRRSKYVQSVIGNTFAEAKNFLNAGRLVCFTGTPCQIAGLKSFLNKDYDNLILVDIICHSVPSPKMWKKYKETQEKRFGSKIEIARFREKKYGFSNPTLMLKFENGKTYAQGNIDPYLGAFVGGMIRKSCPQCAFKGWQRVSDFTMYDCWSIGRFFSELDDNKGAGGLLVHSSKAASILPELKKYADIREINLQKSMKLDGKKATGFASLNPRRDEFFADLDQMDFYALKKKYYPASMSSRFFSVVKPIVYKMGVLKFLNSIKRFVVNSRS